MKHLFYKVGETQLDELHTMPNEAVRKKFLLKTQPRPNILESEKKIHKQAKWNRRCKAEWGIQTKHGQWADFSVQITPWQQGKKWGGGTHNLLNKSVCKQVAGLIIKLSGEKSPHYFGNSSNGSTPFVPHEVSQMFGRKKGYVDLTAKYRKELV